MAATDAILEILLPFPLLNDESYQLGIFTAVIGMTWFKELKCLMQLVIHDYSKLSVWPSILLDGLMGRWVSGLVYKFFVQGDIQSIELQCEQK